MDSSYSSPRVHDNPGKRPLLSWEDVHPYLHQPFIDPPSNLAALLSARSYTPPERSKGTSKSETGIPPCAHLLSEVSSLLGEHQPLTSTRTPALEKRPQRQRTSMVGTRNASKKVGRPRKPTDVAQAEDAKERRRRQVRLAQRAYRSRSIVNVENLKARVAHLEAIIQNMSEETVSFSNLLVQSGALASHGNIARRLREMSQRCLNLAKDVEIECNEENIYPKEVSTSSPQPSADETIRLPPPIETSLSSYHGLYLPQSPNTPHSISKSDTTSMDLSEFSCQLRLSCLYNGLLMLTNPSTTIDSLRRPFRLLLSLVNRETITSFFEASFQARLNRESPKGFSEIPFFQLGGAGTHYPRTSAQLQTTEACHQEWPTVKRPLSHLSPANHEGLGGIWFDIQDLEEYLRENKVRLLVYPPASAEMNSPGIVINAGCFIKQLVSRAICLGHSPGFRRIDIEMALSAASWAHSM